MGWRENIQLHQVLRNYFKTISLFLFWHAQQHIWIKQICSLQKRWSQWTSLSDSFLIIHNTKFTISTLTLLIVPVTCFYFSNKLNLDYWTSQYSPVYVRFWYVEEHWLSQVSTSFYIKSFKEKYMDGSMGLFIWYLIRNGFTKLERYAQK